jgi:hypothetical protein
MPGRQVKRRPRKKTPRKPRSHILVEKPVFQVVPGLATLLGEVGYFILDISGRVQKFGRVQIHVRLHIFIRYVRRILIFVKGRAFLNLQAIARKVRAAELDGKRECGGPVLAALRWQPVHEVEADIFKAGVGGRAHGPLGLFPIVPPPEKLRMALFADWTPMEIL